MKSDHPALAKVQKLLLKISSNLQKADENTFTLRHESARAFIRVDEEDTTSFVTIEILMVKELTLTPELLEFVGHGERSQYSYLDGKISMRKSQTSCGRMTSSTNTTVVMITSIRKVFAQSGISDPPPDSARRALSAMTVADRVGAWSGSAQLPRRHTWASLQSQIGVDSRGRRRKVPTPL